MFGSLSEKLSTTLKKIAGKSKLTDANIQEALDEVRLALLDADVALEVVKEFVQAVSAKALGQEVSKGLSPGQFFIKIVQTELTELMGTSNSELNLKTVPPAVILLAGLQGSGKTTSTAKLAKYLIAQNKKVLTVSCDIYRPAAILQLETVTKAVGAEFFPSSVDMQPKAIAQAAMAYARQHQFDVLLIDTAGRMHIDKAMMTQVAELHDITSPAETLFVVDSMTGQDAVQTARAFNETLELSGVILTKTDGDARGGAALSIRHITGKPIKFMGTGEKLDALTPFFPDRVASRILGMGDMLSLIDQIQQQVDEKQAKNLTDKFMRGGRGFDLVDMQEQLKQMEKLGGMGSMMDKIPGLASVPPNMRKKVMGSDGQFKKMICIIDSMTRTEKSRPQLIKGSRKKRIADGSGVNLAQVNKLLKQFEQMQRMMKKFGSPAKFGGMMQNFKGKLPPGMFGDGL